jgi:succinate dehydrogenase hydrophobic anchor subunit
MIKHSTIWWLQKLTAVFIIFTILLSNIYPKLFIISAILIGIHLLIGTESILKDYIHDTMLHYMLYYGVCAAFLYFLHIIYIIY